MSFPVTIGRLYIHSSIKPIPKKEYEDAMWHIEATRQTSFSSALADDECEYGKIIGYVDLVDVVTESESPWFEGKYGWVLENPVILPKAIPAKGKLGIWEYNF